MNLATDDGRLNLAGVLLFAERPEWIVPQFIVKAVRYPGNSIIRNPILVSYVAKGLLPYKRLGSGIKRALDAWSQIDFADDRDGCLFTATVHRKTGITSGKILTALKQDRHLTIPELAALIGVTERSIERNIKNCRTRDACAASDQPGAAIGRFHDLQ
jgi:predicted HTH transcriptional regulator